MDQKNPLSEPPLEARSSKQFYFLDGEKNWKESSWVWTAFSDQRFVGDGAQSNHLAWNQNLDDEFLRPQILDVANGWLGGPLNETIWTEASPAGCQNL